MNTQQIRVILNDESIMVDTIEQAQHIADENQLDLVEVAPNVYKVMNYSKYLYTQKKQAKSHKHTNKHNTKEVQFSLNIAEHDIQRKVTDIVKWLNKGAHVRVVVKLRGREQNRPDAGHQVMNRILDNIKQCHDSIIISTIQISESGRDITTMLRNAS